MKAPIARKLAELAHELRETYSDEAKSWKTNANNEKREIEKVQALSDETGVIVLRGADSGLLTVYFCYWLQFRDSGQWRWILPTYDKAYGMARFAQALQEAETSNFKTNTGFPGG